MESAVREALERRAEIKELRIAQSRTDRKRGTNF
jgi:hypothetical protein